MGRLGIRIANVLLATLCCFQVAGVVNKISADALVPELREAPAMQQAVPVRATQWADRERILSRNLFGAQIVALQPEPEPEPDPDQDLEETKLPVQLLGTLLSGVPSRSKAVISERGAPEPELLAEGEPLERHPQARIAKIERKRVILQNGSRREELLLSEEVPTPAAPKRTASRRPSRRSTTRAANRTPPTRSKSIADQLREATAGGLAGQGAQELLTQARITPLWEEGEMAGMEVRDIVPGSVYEKIGLSDGDVISSFNGIKLDNEAAGAKVLAQFGKADEYEIVLSDGTVKTVSSSELTGLLGTGAATGAPE